ncbi:MAG: hypothetical protein K0R40_4405 [Burkholderiales bacterium]|nr:hypothetical protein [Burkholderiales bacterium]
MRILIDEEDVEVGGVAELLAAELAVADDGERRRIAPVLARQQPPRQLEDDLKDRVGQRGEVVGEALDGEQARQVLGEQAEHLRLVRLAQDVHLPLGVPVGGIDLVP